MFIIDSKETGKVLSSNASEERSAAVDESEDEIDVPEEVENSFEILFEGLQDEVWDCFTCMNKICDKPSGCRTQQYDGPLPKILHEYASVCLCLMSIKLWTTYLGSIQCTQWTTTFQCQAFPQQRNSHGMERRLHVPSLPVEISYLISAFRMSLVGHAKLTSSLSFFVRAHTLLSCRL